LLLFAKHWIRCDAISLAGLPSLFARLRFERALKALADSAHECLRHYAGADWPDRKASSSDARFLALDFELDGLRKDAHLLQAGWLPFEGNTISLAHSQSVDIKSDAQLNDVAVTIHGIGEQRAAVGQPIGEVIPQLIEAMSGRILVAHAAVIEYHALTRATEAVFGVKLPIRSICTLQLEHRLNPNLVGQEAYRLGNTRQRYGLPQYSAHDALTDAVAAAELFQAQLSRVRKGTALADLEV